MKKLLWFAFVSVFVVYAASAQEYSSYPKGAVLHVTSFPSGATVTVDGVTMTDRDDDTTLVTPLHFDLSLGKHVINIGLADPGWAPYTQTVNITKKDNDLSATLLPVLTQGLQGSAGPIGPPGKDGAPGIQGPQGIPGLSIVGPQGLPGAPGIAGAQGNPGANGTPGAQGIQGIPGQAGANGKDGAPGPQGLPGLNGANGAPGIQGPAGSGSYHGTWSPTGTYNEGDMVFRDPSVGGSRGPFWCVNDTGCASTADPAVDSTNWTFCCGTATLGYNYPATSGGFNGPFGSGISVATYTSTPFNVNDATTYSTLTVTVNSFQGSSSTTTTKCFSISPGDNNPGFLFGLFQSQYGYTTFCSFPYGQPPIGCSVTGSIDSQGDAVATCTTTVTNPPGSMTFTIQKNGAATGLTVSASAAGTFTVTSSVQFSPHDTLSFVLANPSGVADTVSGSWSIQ